MQLKVLVAIDFSAPAPWAANYAVKLAARLKSPLIFLGVLPAGLADHDAGSSLVPAAIPEAYRQRLEEVVRLTQVEGVSLEIFLSAGSFFEEIRHFLSGPERFQFFVIGVPSEAPSEAMEPLTSALKGLHRSFTGEILLVREQGKIARLTEFDQRLQGRKS
jgi:hypothetical protein